MKRSNNDIRDALKAAGVPQWALAERAGYSPNYFCALLRHEFEAEQKLNLLDMIDDLRREREGNQ